jgi:ectoine hydroxylase
MQLTLSQIEKYREDGFLLLENLFTNAEVSLMLQEMNLIINKDCPRRILEKSGHVRSFFAPESDSDIFRRVLKSARLVKPSMQLLGTPVYVHQTKINSKFSLRGDWWEWHQDYIFWKKDDGMPSPNVLTAMLFLNDINEFNGPMLLVPGSHKEGTIDSEEKKKAGLETDPAFASYRASTSYMSALTTDLKYVLEREMLDKWVKKKGLYSAKGPKGSVLFFDGNIFHCSSNNMSPWDRHAFLVTFNSVFNSLEAISNPRPEFIANRNFEEIVPSSGSIVG